MNNDILGKTVVIQQTNEEDALESVTESTFTVVGYVATPLYMDMNRGTTSVGNGSLSGFFYVLPEALEMEYIPEIHITVPGNYDIFTDKYKDAMETSADTLEPQLQKFADERLETARAEAQKEYQDGLNEYRDGLNEYHKEKAKADKELADAYQDLLKAEKEIQNNEKLLKDGEDQIAEARVTLSKNELTLANSKTEAYAQLAEANNELIQNYKTISENLRSIETGKLEIETGLIQIETGIVQIEAGIEQIDSGVEQLEMVIELLDISIEAIESTLDGMNDFDDFLDIPLPDFSFDISGVFAESSTPAEDAEETLPEETEPTEQEPDEDDSQLTCKADGRCAETAGRAGRATE